MGYNGGKTLEQRFNDKWDLAEDGCWIWRFPLKGHHRPQAGTFSLNGHVMCAYRASHIMYNGAIPDGMVIRHTCDNGLCVNPAHLLYGTAAENTADMYDRGRNQNPKGEAHCSAKLTEDDVRAIREEMDNAPRGTLSRLSRKYGVTHSTLQDIISGKTWRHTMPD